MNTGLTPRLLTLEQAAAYLGLPLATTRKLGIGVVQMGGRVRYDRLALDAHLDAVSGLDSQSPPAKDDDPEAALEQFARHFKAAAGHA
ncbi:MAG TPA: hypothetical protein VL358_04830 [Caulobacteraceae bacterium]|jgi:excisionase family DNA binding protein|nr:hypothetical protein [Caulobacteraceae bacterium]